jgi:ribosomal protein S18 acetylase RimI-like enzyme
VRPIDPGPRVAEILARAFVDDPGYVWVLQDDATRAARLAWLYDRLVRVYARIHARVFMEEEDSVACFLAPGQAVGLLDFLRAGLVRAPSRLSTGATARALYASSRIERLRTRVTKGQPHWYLDQLAVDPPAQGRGLGRRLLKECLTSLVEPAGLPCFLVTTKESNVAFYRGSGFRVGEEVRIGGFRAWGMLWGP